MTEFQRQPTHRYDDPLDLVWVTCAERIGFRIQRTPHAYASSDGRGTILIAVDELFDPDDSLAQMIFHELCHALVEGEQGETQVDWGLGNSHGNNPWREHACLRLQAYLAGQVGLRNFLAPTTDFRSSFWNTMLDDPFAADRENGGRREKSCVAARLGAWRASTPRWRPHLDAALAASAAIAAAASRVVCALSEPWSFEAPGRPSSDDPGLPSLYVTVDNPPDRHPAGHSCLAPHFHDKSCSDCAWSFTERRALRCRHAPGIALKGAPSACWRWEPGDELDCRNCGACCREAYHSVEISRREPINRRHPHLVATFDTHRKLRREGMRCAALQGGTTASEPYACGIYDDRPRTCREFTRGSANCLDARRRVGLSL